MSPGGGARKTHGPGSAGRGEGVGGPAEVRHAPVPQLEGAQQVGPGGRDEEEVQACPQTLQDVHEGCVQRFGVAQGDPETGTQQCPERTALPRSEPPVNREPFAADLETDEVHEPPPLRAPRKETGDET